jgi:hypothetical protein
MTRARENSVRAWMRRATTRVVIEVAARGRAGDAPEAVMDELWTQKAALGEMLRRGEFDGDYYAKI